MSDPVASLVLDLLEWIGAEPRPYREVIDVWRTSCPRLPVWETANEHGLLEHKHVQGHEAMVSVSQRGINLLAAYRMSALVAPILCTGTSV